MNTLANLDRAARALGVLVERVVFVGGATVDLFITDLAAGPARYTEDVDVIIRVSSRTEYLVDLAEKMRAQGFKEDMREDAPICRWVHGDLTVDVMPTAGEILGFTNRWYEEGIAHAREVEVASGVVIRVLTAPYFVATKLEAFKGRGKRDFLGSADLEDIVRVVDGRAELPSEITQCGEELRGYLMTEIAALLRDDDFLDALPGHLMGDATSQARAEIVLARLSAAAGSKK